jgi:hypothetical protein
VAKKRKSGLVESFVEVFLPPRRFYLRFDGERAVFSEPSRGWEITLRPRLAITEERGRLMCVAVDDFDESSLPESARVEHPFAHPRVLVGNYDVAVAFVRYCLSQARHPFTRTMVRPHLILHPTAVPPDGVSDIEERALLDLAADAGAQRAAVHVGAVLTATEVAAYSCDVVWEPP